MQAGRSSARAQRITIGLGAVIGALALGAPAAVGQVVPTLVNDIRPGGASSNPNGLTVAGNQLFFTASSSPDTGLELYKSDGTAAGTGLVKDIIPGAGASNPAFYAPLGNSVVFTAFSGPDGGQDDEPWVSDGTAAGTQRLADITPGVTSSSPNGFTTFNGFAYFSADNGTTGN